MNFDRKSYTPFYGKIQVTLSNGVVIECSSTAELNRRIEEETKKFYYENQERSMQQDIDEINRIGLPAWLKKKMK